LNDRWSCGALLSIAACIFPLTAQAAPPNDNFADAAVITGDTGTFIETNVGATREEPNEPHNVTDFDGASIWWRWTAPENGPFTFETFASDFDTVIGIYTGNSVGALTRVVSNDDNQGGNVGTSGVTFYAQQGTEYRISVAGYEGENGVETGNVNLKRRRASLPANDDFAFGADLSGPSGTVQGDNIEATLEPTEPFPEDSVDTLITDASVWWTWTPQQSGTVTFDTAGSDFWTVLSVYTGSTLVGMEQVAARTVFPPNRAAVQFPAEAGTTYRVSVAGFLGERGNIDLAWDLESTGSPPENDDFANQQTLSGTSGSIAADNLLATLEPGEPVHAGQDAGASVWWNWTAPKSGVFVFDTAGSEFDTVLAVYNGADVTSLVEVASNDDVSGTDETSRVIFNAQAGTTYQVAVAGSGSETGSLLLNWRQDLTSVINIINQLLLD
jgi:hypothetical protein